MMLGTVLAIAGLQQVTLTGVVRDSIDLEPIAFAEVTVTPVGDEAGVASASSDRFGAFVVPGVRAAGPVRVEVEAFGYGGWGRAYDVLPSDPLRVLLSPTPIRLEGVVAAVSGRPGDPISLSRDAFVIDSVLLRSFPTILEADVLRATSVSPSASATSDYSSVPFIRGGTSDGTPVLLDGVRLFNAFHLGGFLSAINAEVVERATLLAGSGGDGFAIGSLSGAIDIATRDGSRDRTRMAGAMGLASSRLSVEGPIGESVSYLVDGRRTWIDGFTRALKKLKVIDGYVPYFFQDVHAKVTGDLGGLRRLSVSGYMNSESLNDVDASERERMAMTWGNAAVSVHYRNRLGATGIVDANLGHSRFTSDMINVEDFRLDVSDDGGDAPSPDTLLSGYGSMSETRADLKVVWHARRAMIIAGAQATRFEADHDYHLSDDCCSWDDMDISAFLSPLALREIGWRMAAYASVEIPLRRGFSTRAGLRVDRFQGLATTLAPFAELGYGASWWRARISASLSHQALASVRNEESLVASFLAYDLLFPVSEAPVPRNAEFLIGWQGSRGGLRVRLDAYARALRNIRLPDLEANPIRSTVLGDPSSWEVAGGAAAGIEASWSWVWDGGISVLGSYRWARVSRTVGSRTYTPRFHRDHEFEFGSSYGRGASSWSARVSLRSGQPVTPVLAIVPAVRYLSRDVDFVVLTEEYNSAKLPHYARIDVGWRRESEVSWFGGGSVVPYVSVANLFSLPNVVGLELENFFGRRHQRVYQSQLPMMPILGVEFRF